jgi:hypothetical protein
MNPFKLNLFFCLAALILITSCSKQNADTTIINQPVVESYLIPGQLITVKLYQQKQLTDTAKYGQPIKGVQVYISDGSKSVLLAETSAGIYTYNDPAFLVAGKTYSLQFKYLSYTVSAQTVMPTKPTNFSIRDTAIYITKSTTTPNSAVDTLDRLSWSNPDSLNHVIAFVNLTGTLLPVKNRNANSSVEINTNRASVYYITQNTFPYYAYYRVVLYRVNSDYINLMNSNAGTSASTSTSQTLTQTYTNIVNGYGIFTAMQEANILYIMVYSS